MQSFLEKEGVSAVARARAVVLHRGKESHPGRGIRNDAQVLEIFKQVVLSSQWWRDKLDIWQFPGPKQKGPVSFEEHGLLFSQAKLVMGIEGAGMSSIVW